MLLAVKYFLFGIEGKTPMHRFDERHQAAVERVRAAHHLFRTVLELAQLAIVVPATGEALAPANGLPKKMQRRSFGQLAEMGVVCLTRIVPPHGGETDGYRLTDYGAFVAADVMLKDPRR